MRPDALPSGPPELHPTPNFLPLMSKQINPTVSQSVSIESALDDAN